MHRTVSDVMTREVVVVDAFTPFKDIVRRMQEHRISAVPVVDEDRTVIGIVSEDDLILKEDRELEGEPRFFESTRRRAARSKAAGLLASDVQSAPVVTIHPEATLGDAARTMHSHHVKRLPVVDGRDRLVGIVSRADLLEVFLRPDADIATEIREDIVRRTLWIEPDTIRVMVRDGVVRLEGQLERRSLAPVLERLALSTEGVVAVDARLSYAIDDLEERLPDPWTAIGPRGVGR
jgi:CBS-domain-containing membrane protein